LPFFGNSGVKLAEMDLVSQPKLAKLLRLTAVPSILIFEHNNSSRSTPQETRSTPQPPQSNTQGPVFHLGGKYYREGPDGALIETSFDAKVGQEAPPTSATLRAAPSDEGLRDAESLLASAKPCNLSFALIEEDRWHVSTCLAASASSKAVKHVTTLQELHGEYARDIGHTKVVLVDGARGSSRSALDLVGHQLAGETVDLIYAHGQPGISIAQALGLEAPVLFVTCYPYNTKVDSKQLTRFQYEDVRALLSRDSCHKT